MALALIPGLFPVLKGATGFVPNHGQIVDTDGNPRPDILFSADMPGAKLYFFKSGFSYVLHQSDASAHPAEDGYRQRMIEEKSHRVDIRFLDSNADPTVRAEGKLPGYTNYYYAHCPQGITKVPSYEKLIIEDIYPHTDLHLSLREDGFKYDLVLRPGAKGQMVAMEVDGAHDISFEGENKLRIRTSLGEIIETIPYSFIENLIVDDRQAVNIVYRIEGENVIRFGIPEYDPARTLVIDPLSTWATYYGGSGIDYGRGVANDAWAYQAGETGSSNFPTSVGAHQGSFGGNRDAYLVKWTKTGTRLWSTYYGGTGRDVAEDVAVDGSSNIYIAGYAFGGFPTTLGSYQPTYTNSEDGFLVKFDAAGNRLWATYLGGEGEDIVYDVACDNSGNIVVGGYTDSNFQISSAGVVQTSRSGNQDAFVMKFNTSGARLWGTYWGGTALDEAHGITTDGSGNVIIAGRTYGNFPVGASAGNTAHQTVAGGGFGDMDWFITKLNPTGTTRLWSTYYGGPNTDRAYDVEVDAADNVIAVGNGWASFPTTFGTIQPFFSGGMGDAAIAKFSSNGTRLWATYLGGTAYDLAFSVDAVGTNDIVVAGETESFFPTINQCQTTCSGTYCGFVTHLDGNGATTIMSTVLGGSGFFNSALDVTCDATANIFVTGFTSSFNFPVGGAATFQPANAGGSADAYMGLYNWDSCNAVILDAEQILLTGQWEDNAIRLDWKVENGVGLQQFEVERENVNGDFLVIGSIQAGVDQNYSFLDHGPESTKAIHRYRVRSIDQDGVSDLSNVVALTGTAPEMQFTIGPNPAEGFADLFVSTELEGGVLDLYDTKGSLVRRYGEIGSGHIRIDLEEIPAGIYIFRLSSGAMQLNRKLLIVSR